MRSRVATGTYKASALVKALKRNAPLSPYRALVSRQMTPDIGRERVA
jgi:hypothetical protein